MITRSRCLKKSGSLGAKPENRRLPDRCLDQITCPGLKEPQKENAKTAKEHHSHSIRKDKKNRTKDKKER